LIQDNIVFQRPGLVVIDEQHRFGVDQRAKLQKTGADVLIMTATPIPRSLAMTLYGDMDYSVIDELPPGRKKTVTKHYSFHQLDHVYCQVKDKLNKGFQAYFVYPLIEESQKSDLKAAEKAFIQLSKFFQGFKTALIHGKIKSKEKNIIMEGFIKNEIQILASTTVIEVGVNVPNSNIMVIEHAERFGLSQLHQLRGRVGRGQDQAYCYLVTKDELSEESAARMKVMEKYTDGFKIANEDLKIRGPGNLLGTKQSGIPPLKFLDVFQNPQLLQKVKKICQGILKKDPQLIRYENSSLREHLFAKYKNDLTYLDIG